MKNSNDTIGNLSRDLLVCSAVPQPTAPPRVPTHIYIYIHESARQISLPVVYATAVMRNMIIELDVKFWTRNRQIALKLLITLRRGRLEKNTEKLSD